MIPSDAVEAALTVLRRDDLWELSDEEEARLILEAAAPYMLAEAWEAGAQAEEDCAPLSRRPPNPYRLHGSRAAAPTHNRSKDD